MWKRLLYLVAAVAVLGGLYAGVQAISPPIVEVVTPVRGPAVQAVYATGTVEATVMMPIAPRVTARLTEMYADEGAQVTKGQVIAQLEDSDVQNTVAQLKARADLARTTFERTERLVKQGAMTRKSKDEAEAALLAAQADLARAEAEAGFLKLTAPADGTIIRRDGEIGQLITPTAPLFWMACCAPLRLSAEVDEEDIPLVKPGQKVLIQSDAFPGQTFSGSVTGFTPKGDSQARTYRVRIGFDEPGTIPLMIGMTAETNIIVSQSDNALLVPTTAVEDGKVQVVEGGRIKSAPVTLGARGASVTAVSGVDPTAHVLKSYSRTLADGDRIRQSRVTFESDAEAATKKKE